MDATSEQLHLLDSTIWIHIARGRLPVAVVDHVATLVEAGAAATNEVITAEVLIGSRSPDDFVRNKDGFAGHVQLPVTESTWDRAAGLGFDLLRRGLAGSLPDLLIAATALQYGAVLVHADRGLDRIAAELQIPVESYVDALGF